ncbi:hypothetical protein [Erwinia billingiae]|uniref:hypothetical protein n=1 Tax=Erwinia billingiae TaxID=182337 RepID=UPI0032096FF3
MQVSTKMIREDLNGIISSLREEDILIPSFWDSCKIGVFIFIFVFTLQVGVILLNPMEDLTDSYFSLAFACILCVICFLGSMSVSGNYQSLPKYVRENSIVFRLLKAKVKVYTTVWMSVGVLAFIVTSLFSLPSVLTSGALFTAMVFLYLLFSADMSRYNLSALSAAITAWRTKSQQS